MLRQQKGHRLCGVYCMRDIRHNVEATNEIVRTRRAFSFRGIMQAKASASPPPNPLRRAFCAPQGVRPEMLRQQKGHRLCGAYCMRDIRHRVETANEGVHVRRMFSFRGIMRAKASASPPPNPLRRAFCAPQGVRPEMLRQQKGHRLCGAYFMRDIRHRDKTTNKTVRTRRAIPYHTSLRAKASASPPPNPLRHARGAPQEVRPEMLRQVKGTGVFACPFYLA